MLALRLLACLALVSLVVAKDVTRLQVGVKVRAPGPRVRLHSLLCSHVFPPDTVQARRLHTNSPERRHSTRPLYCGSTNPLMFHHHARAACSRSHGGVQGMLTDGTVFDSSVNAGREPIAFELGQGRVIKGWDQGILGMW
jgi:hypothetical protein